MSSFANRLREEIDYLGISQRELAEKAGIKKRALDMYVGYRESMPPADVAVKLARVLNVTVEYLVTGERENTKNPQNTISVKKIEKDLGRCSEKTQQFFETAIHLFAEHEKQH